MANGQSTPGPSTGGLGDYQAIADYSKQENLKAMWASAVITADGGKAGATKTAIQESGQNS